MHIPCWDGLVVSLSYVVGHTKDYHKNGTNCLPAWHAGVMVGVMHLKDLLG